MQNNRNYFIAIALSVLIVLGWQFLYMNPRIEAQRKAQEAQKAQQQSEQTQAPAAGGQPAPHTSGAAPTGQPAATAPPADALANAPRLAIDTEALSCAVNLAGSRHDSLPLTGQPSPTDTTHPPNTP
ncbi:membrane protein insertase YidC, partial [Rhizobium sp. SEMIA 4085]|uniref:membrane protein insertase YidC n=1 Tax=Rhizobium sp. SEMIA 4085 TaxID=2137761 RepID=UPI0014789457